MVSGSFSCRPFAHLSLSTQTRIRQQPKVMCYLLAYHPLGQPIMEDEALELLLQQPDIEIAAAHERRLEKLRREKVAAAYEVEFDEICEKHADFHDDFIKSAKIFFLHIATLESLIEACDTEDDMERGLILEIEELSITCYKNNLYGRVEIFNGIHKKFVACLQAGLNDIILFPNCDRFTAESDPKELRSGLKEQLFESRFRVYKVRLYRARIQELYDRAMKKLELARKTSMAMDKAMHGTLQRKGSDNPGSVGTGTGDETAHVGDGTTGA